MANGGDRPGQIKQHGTMDMVLYRGTGNHMCLHGLEEHSPHEDFNLGDRILPDSVTTPEFSGYLSKFPTVSSWGVNHFSRKF